MGRPLTLLLEAVTSPYSRNSDTWVSSQQQAIIERKSSNKENESWRRDNRIGKDHELHVLYEYQM